MRDSIRLHKYQILGNSYLILSPDENRHAREVFGNPGAGAGPDPVLGPELVRRLCSLDYGIGSSGVVLGPLRGPGGSIGLHIYNEDGSRCNFSGNAIRMMGRYLVDAGVVRGHVGDRLALDVIGLPPEARLPYPEPVVHRGVIEITAAGGRAIRAILPRPAIGRSAIVVSPDAYREVERPAGAPGASDVWLTVPALAGLGQRLARPRRWTSTAFVNVGNPHCVTFVDTLDALPDRRFADLDVKDLVALSYGPPKEPGSDLAAVFPDGCNLQFAYVGRDRARIHLRTFERGGGPTNSSGSSSSAAAAAAFARGLVGADLTVEMVGGEMKISLRGGPSDIAGIELESEVVRVATIDARADSGDLVL